MRLSLFMSVLGLFYMPLLAANIFAEDLPNEAQVIVEAMNRDIDAIKKKAEQDTEAAIQKTIDSLQKLQDTFTKAAKLDEAVAIRDYIRNLRTGGIAPTPAPSNMSGYASKVGQVVYFDLTGATSSGSGWLFGTDIYTCDSTLASAAVHSGALKMGEKGVVKVTVLPGQSSYESSTKNGITSSGWLSYHTSYKIERVSWIKPKESK